MDVPKGVHASRSGISVAGSVYTAQASSCLCFHCPLGFMVPLPGQAGMRGSPDLARRLISRIPIQLLATSLLIPPRLQGCPQVYGSLPLADPHPQMACAAWGPGCSFPEPHSWPVKGGRRRLSVPESACECPGAAEAGGHRPGLAAALAVGVTFSPLCLWAVTVAHCSGECLKLAAVAPLARLAVGWEPCGRGRRPLHLGRTHTEALSTGCLCPCPAHTGCFVAFS